MQKSSFRNATWILSAIATIAFASLANVHLVHGRVDARAYLSGRWQGVVTEVHAPCGEHAGRRVEARRVFDIARSRGGLTLRERGTNARCRLVLGDGDVTLASVPGRCRLSGEDVSLTLMQRTDGSDALELHAQSDAAACAFTLDGTLANPR